MKDVAKIPVRSLPFRIEGHCIGQVIKISEDKLLVDYDGNPHGPLVARTTASFENHRGGITAGVELGAIPFR